jgi:hypothetical protein
VKRDCVYLAKSDRENHPFSIIPGCLVAGDRAIHFILPTRQYRAKSRLMRRSTDLSAEACGAVEL